MYFYDPSMDKIDYEIKFDVFMKATVNTAYSDFIKYKRLPATLQVDPGESFPSLCQSCHACKQFKPWSGTWQIVGSNCLTFQYYS